MSGDLAALAALAKAATPGPWNTRRPTMADLREHRICNADYGRVACYCSALDWMTLDEYGEHIEAIANTPAEADAAYIAAASPDVVLALIEELMEAKAALARVETQTADYAEYAYHPSIPPGEWTILRADCVVETYRAALRGDGDE